MQNKRVAKFSVELYDRPEDLFVRNLLALSYGPKKPLVMEAILAAYGQDTGCYASAPEIMSLRAQQLGVRVYPGSGRAPHEAAGAQPQKSVQAEAGERAGRVRPDADAGVCGKQENREVSPQDPAGAPLGVLRALRG